MSKETVRDRFLRKVMKKAVRRVNKKLPPGEPPLVWPKDEDLPVAQKQKATKG